MTVMEISIVVFYLSSKQLAEIWCVFVIFMANSIFAL